MSLTEKQQAYLSEIMIHIDECGYPPTRAELAESFNVHPNAAQQHIDALIKKGYIEVTPRASRGIKVIKTGDE